MSNEPTTVRGTSPQPALPAPLPVPLPAPVPLPVPVPAPRRPAAATNLEVDVLSIAPLVVRVSGEIDIASAPNLREELLGVMRRYGARLALDLGGVSFMDCAGINVLLAARHHAQLEGGRVCVVQASRRAQKVLILAGLDQEFRPDPVDGKPAQPGASDARREATAAPQPGTTTWGLANQGRGASLPLKSPSG